MSRLTKPEQLVLCALLSLVLVGLSVRSWWSAYAPKAALQLSTR